MEEKAALADLGRMEGPYGYMKVMRETTKIVSVRSLRESVI